MALRNINIDFPFNDSINGDFLKLNQLDKPAIKADLMHLIMTNKGDRMYMPDFGTNLRNYLFDMNDSISQANIKTEIIDAVKKYIPNLRINEITITESESNPNAVIVSLDYTVTDDVFEVNDNLSVII